MSRKNMMLVLSGSALCLTSVASAGTPDFDRAYAAELRADTAAYTSLLQAGGSGHDGFFHIGDGSGNNRLNIGGLLQFRWVYNNRDSGDFAGTGNEDGAVGFETHHTQLNFSGNVISPNWQYGIMLEFGTGDGGNNSAGSNANIRDSWVQYNFEGDNSGTFIKFGQFVSPVLPEDAASDAVGLASSRSVTNEFFSGGRIQGVTLGHGNDQYKGSITLHDGMGDQARGQAGSENTELQSEAADWGIAARFDYKIEGDWSQFDDATSWKGSSNAFRIGAGFNYETGGDTGGLNTAATADETYTLWTIDATYEGNGWNASAAIIGNNTEFNATGGGPDISHTGYVIQGGYFVQDDLELFARYESIDIDSDLGLAEDTQSFLTFGGNYYLTPQSHAAKVTVDCVYALDDATTLGAAGGLGLGDTGLLGGSDEELVFRAQFQLVF